MLESQAALETVPGRRQALRRGLGKFSGSGERRRKSKEEIGLMVLTESEKACQNHRLR
jgi:hypothetical protein